MVWARSSKANAAKLGKYSLLVAVDAWLVEWIDAVEFGTHHS